MGVLSSRWTELDPHTEQIRLWNSTKRFRVVPAGRRSGKTEIAKRFVVRQALKTIIADAWFVCAAPTHAQAKRIYWKDLKALVPKNKIEAISESELTIRLINGAEISVVGMDAPERIEGRPLDGIICDEYANMKSGVWKENLRPALSTRGRPGWAWFIGVPEGRNHYWKLFQNALRKDWTDWGVFQWVSSDILDPAEIEAARKDLDELTFQQEYEASFVTFSGRCYYPFKRGTHATESVTYDPTLPLIFAFDFNRSPGIASVLQEQPYLGSNPLVADQITAAIGEVWIPRNSNTPAVCRKLALDWQNHNREIFIHGDATGGAIKTSSVDGSDWDLIEKHLGPEFPGQIRMRVPSSNPSERARINALNSRIQSSDELIHFLADPDMAPNTINCLEGTTLLEGGAGEIDKKSDAEMSHISDAIGYYVAEQFPVRGKRVGYREVG